MSFSLVWLARKLTARLRSGLIFRGSMARIFMHWGNLVPFLFHSILFLGIWENSHSLDTNWANSTFLTLIFSLMNLECLASLGSQGIALPQCLSICTPRRKAARPYFQIRRKGPQLMPPLYEWITRMICFNFHWHSGDGFVVLGLPSVVPSWSAIVAWRQSCHQRYASMPLVVVTFRCQMVYDTLDSDESILE